MISLKEVLAYRKAMFKKSYDIVEKKGHDYNKKQQLSGDTLFNLRVCELLGIVPRAEVGILVRLSDKFMRMISLENTDNVNEESFEDTVADIHNYIDYLSLMRKKRRGKK